MKHPINPVTPRLEAIMETCNVVPTLESVDKILWCNRLNETSSAVHFAWYYLFFNILHFEIWGFS